VIVAVPGGSTRRHEALVAVFPVGFRTLPWIHDFLEFAAHRLLRDTTPPASETPAPTDGDLVVPDGMVIGDSPAIAKLMTNLRATVRSRLDVLLLGETGTGKELFARLIHASGPSATGPFVAINCAAIPSELLEAELFGVVGRVATGVDPKPGHFLQADGGSIFLDEIGELTDPLQAKLLRVLQEREILSLGALAPRRINVRVIAASNSDLYGRTRSGRFRADLYYRLRGLQFHIPPLRERPEDIPALVLSFVSRACTTYGKSIAGVSRRALSLLMTHSWPGNVRELQNEVERAVLLCHTGGVLQSEHFAPVKRLVETAPPATEAPDSDSDTPPRIEDAPLDLQARVNAVEKQAILDALRQTLGNRSKAAQLLGITRNGLSMKMTRLGLNGK
jgi:two-component system response regulator AtoC